MQLPATIRNIASSRYRREDIGIAVLLLAGVTVGIAIATDGAVSRAINGIAGILWIGAAWILLNSLRRTTRFWSKLALIVVIGLVLVIIVRPSDLAMAFAGFGIAGAAIAYLTGSRGLIWATLLPALWLPLHLGTAVIKAAYRSITDEPATLRSDPPPTAAIVPLTMILATMLAAWLVQRFIERRGQRR